MRRTAEQLRQDALQIWQAGVEAVKPSVLIPQFVGVEGDLFFIGDEEFDLRKVERICVVGAGKAGGGMAVALETALGERVLREKKVTGWVNVPADCLRPTQAIHFHAARPAGINEPTAEGVAGMEEILRRVAQLGPRDLCICLISGGGSALLPAPVDGLDLETKLQLTREIAARGGNIAELNTVRRELSRVKGGGLAAACRAGHLVSLILSDVPGDDLATIASGPTVPRESTPEAAIEVLGKLGLDSHPAGKKAIEILKDPRPTLQSRCRVTNILIGNNATAVDAAGVQAEKLGYSHAMVSAREPEGPVSEVAEKLAEMAVRMRDSDGPDCLISGGEPTMILCNESVRGLGGRNQHLALTMLDKINDWSGLAFVSGGTDGEDGPTDAAGGFADELVAERAKELNLDLGDYLARNDAYHALERLEALIKTGPTHTNVGDIRVMTVGSIAVG
jgi:glycerate 2-kinase